jgi:hypothetical protein
VPLEDIVFSGGTQNQQEPRELQRSANGAGDKYDWHLASTMRAPTMRARPQLGPMIPHAQNDVSFDYRLHMRSAPAFELQVHGLRLESGLLQCLSDGRAQSAPSGMSEHPCSSDWGVGGAATRMMSMLRQAPPGLENATSAPLSAPFDWGSWDDSDS